jgi:predicted CopG family antitoxin
MPEQPIYLTELRFTNMGWKSDAIAAAEAQVARMNGKKTPEELNREAAIQATQAASIFAPLMRWLEQQANLQPVSKEFLRTRGVPKDIIEQAVVVGGVGTKEGVSFSDVIQKLISALQLKLTVLGELLEKVRKPMADFRNFQNEVQEFVTTRADGAKKLMQNVVNAVDQTFENLNQDRIFNSLDLAFVLGAESNHPAFELIKPSSSNAEEQPPSDHEVALEDMQNAINEQFLYTDEIAAQYSAEEYNQLVQNTSVVLVGREKPVTANEVRTSPVVRNQIGMVLRPTPANAPAVRDAQNQLQSYHSETRQMQTQINQKQIKVAQQLAEVEPVLSQIHKASADVRTALDQLQHVLTSPGLNASNLPQMKQINKMLNEAVLQVRIEVDSSLALALGGGGSRSSSVQFMPKPEFVSPALQQQASKLESLKATAIASIKQGSPK